MAHLSLDEEKAWACYKNRPEYAPLLESLFPDTFKRDICDRIKTMEDIYPITGIDCEERSILWSAMRNLTHLIYFDQSCLITQAYNEGWVPDWNNNSEVKYELYWDLSGGGFRLDVVDNYSSFSYVGSRLIFRERRLGEDAVKKFVDVYKGWLTYNGK